MNARTHWSNWGLFAVAAALVLVAAVAAGCIRSDGDPPSFDCTDLGLAAAAVAPEATRGSSSWKKADPPRQATRPSGLTSSSASRRPKTPDIDIEFGPCG